MRGLSVSKKLEVLEHFFSGVPYSEIAARTGVAAGSITAIVNEAKAGRLPTTRSWRSSAAAAWAWSTKPAT